MIHDLHLQKISWFSPIYEIEMNIANNYLIIIIKCHLYWVQNLLQSLHEDLELGKGRWPSQTQKQCYMD